MGYYTSYELTMDNMAGPTLRPVVGVDGDGKEATIYVKEDFDPEVAKRRLFDLAGYSNIFGEGIKWYDHVKDMIQLSSEFPNVLFTLEGVGEESDDQWIKYFKGGKMQVAKAKISFDPFDETQLK